MKKRLFLIYILVLASVCAIPTFASAGGRSWYIRRSPNHDAPTIEAEAKELLKQYDAYYLDYACSKVNGEKVIYLTFDVGYENGNVAKALDVLKEENVKGAFFVLSHFVKSAPELLKRIKADGHLVCNHTSTHKNPCTLTEKELENEIRTLEEQYHSVTGEHLSPFFRPPEGKYDEKTLQTAKRMGYKTVFWSLAYADWDDASAPSDEKAMSILKNNTHTGAIVLIHPTSNINARILKNMISYWKNEGYRFGSLEELEG